MKIVVTPRGFAKCGLDNVKKIESAGFLVEYNDTGNAYTKEEFYEKTNDADGVIVGVESVDKAYIDAHPTVKAVVKFGVGTDNIDVEYCREKGVFVGRTVGSNARSVAETAISFLFADSKNLYESIADTRQHKWSKQTGYELENKTIGIVGFGAIGKKVAQIAFGLGMRVLAYDPYAIDREAAQAFNVGVVDFEEILKRSDFVSLHMPLTAETKNFVTLTEMNKMKPSAVLINTARGGIVNEADLFAALTNNVIRAAYFDVMVSEPPAKDEPLLDLPNFYLTPHIASRSKEAEKNTADMATQIMIDALKKQN
ncbi:MAG: phosphoglycerate dehydrogenase [Clostridia bacterium]|nr:phosphoglycerate dehydrogenase [Clostridia bacterium]